ncbi:MAG: zf-HC2 domain-containing protein, partial [Planctomycetota bacterium]|nr:zf-HC2 domain-containing protein [Planctomycetota bacterium]
MDCRRVRERIGELIDGALTEEEVRALNAHFLECNECRKIYEEEKGVWGLLGEYSPLEPSPDFVRDVMARVKAKEMSMRRVLHRVLVAVSA